MRACLLALAVSLTLAAPAAAQSYQWLGGLDLFVPVHQHYDDEPKSVLPRGLLGYDRDTHMGSLLFIPEQCYTFWTWRPSPGHGAIVALMPVALRTYGLVHESGHIRLETVPVMFYCVPVAVPKGDHP